MKHRTHDSALVLPARRTGVETGECSLCPLDRATATGTGACTRRALLVVVALASLAACAPRAPQIALDAERPSAFPEQAYRRAAAAGTLVYRVDAAASLVTIDVRRAGSLARLGHDHVVAAHDVHGYVLPDTRQADLYVALERLVVDEPDLRAAAGFTTEISQEAITATRRNMLDKVLEAERYPFALIHVGRVGERVLDASITLHGVTREVQIPVEVASEPGIVAVSGQFAFAQSDFGIVPLSILGGAIQVQDQVDVRFRIRAGALD
jgi:hypothetical protein